MGVRVRDVVTSRLDDLRYEPIETRVRARLAGEPVVDSTRAVLVWEPRRVVPSYAVPLADVTAELVAIEAGDDLSAVAALPPDVSRRALLDPRVPFAVHTTAGDPVGVRVGDRVCAGFRPADPDLAGYVLLDFSGADSWQEEDEDVAGHPHDPYHRIEVLRSSRHVRLELEGRVLADTTRARVMLESMLPTRYYLPRADVVPQLRPSATRTTCAYKGQASYWSVDLGDAVVDDLVWAYEEPLHDAEPVRGLVAFFHERVDLVVDGEQRPRPVTPWS